MPTLVLAYSVCVCVSVPLHCSGQSLALCNMWLYIGILCSMGMRWKLKKNKSDSHWRSDFRASDAKAVSALAKAIKKQKQSSRANNNRTSCFLWVQLNILLLTLQCMGAIHSFSRTMRSTTPPASKCDCWHCARHPWQCVHKRKGKETPLPKSRTHHPT